MIELFNEDSKSQESPVFSVGLGTYVILSAYNFEDKQEVYPPENARKAQMAIVQKLSFVGGKIPDGVACEEFVPISDRELDIEYTYKEDVTQCGLWNLSACQNLVIMSVPGAYQLRLNDPAAVGRVVILAERYRKDEIQYLPRDLFLGVV